MNGDVPECKNDREIWIALATFNGDAYLNQLLESILSQSFQNWHLLVRDDGSDDRSLSVIERYSRLDGRIEVVKDASANLGAKNNFGFLLEQCLKRGAMYVMLCDQDDIWLPEKISETVSLMKDTEAERGPEEPILVYSDMQVVSETLVELAPSFMRYQRLKNRELEPFRCLLTQNYVSGCTMMCNAALLRIALPLGKTPLLHDWWLALVAATFGRIEFLDKSTLLYRKHGNNYVGPNKFWHVYSPFNRRIFSMIGELRTKMLYTIFQAGEILKKIDDESGYDAVVYQAIKKYSEFLDLSFVDRIAFIFQSGVAPQGIWRKFVIGIALVSLPRKRPMNVDPI